MKFIQEILGTWPSALQTQLFSIDTHIITVLNLIESVVLSLLLIIFAPKLNSLILKRIGPKLKRLDMTALKVVVRMSRFALMFLGAWIILHVVGLDTWVMQQFQYVYGVIQGILDLKICKIGNSQLTLLSLLYILALSYLLVRATGQLRTLLLNKYLVKTKMDSGARQTFASAVQYGVLFVGFVILLQTAGIDLSAMTVMLGALSIGLSFGLQTITNNLVSGIIILFERPIKLGDQVQIGDVTGEVIDISLRATTVMASNNIAIVVPNSQFVSSNVINWTFRGRKVGIKCPFTVSASKDPESVKRMLLEAASLSNAVEKDPPPVVSLDEFSKDTQKFSLRVWTDIANRETLPSELNFEVSKRLRQAEAEEAATKSEEENAQKGADDAAPKAAEDGAQKVTEEIAKKMDEIPKKMDEIPMQKMYLVPRP